MMRKAIRRERKDKMIHEQISIKEKGSEAYARLVTYLWDASLELSIKTRPLVLICPGGAYHMTSDREAEAVAVKIMGMGFHAAVLRYSVAPAEYPTALTETARAVRILRERAGEWGIDGDKIVVMGFSAGGHLAASYGVFWKERWLAEEVGCSTEQLRPNGLLLGYPVITSERAWIHEGSFRNLLGKQWNEELLGRLSLEKQVGPQTPKTFLWHTFADNTVPVENSILWVQAMCRQGIPVEFHLYEKGGHGLSLASALTNNPADTCIQEECQSWITLAEAWLRNL